MFKEGDKIWFKGGNNTFFQGKIIRSNSNEKEYAIKIIRNTQQGKVYYENRKAIEIDLISDKDFQININDKVTVRNTKDETKPNGSMYGVIQKTKDKKHPFHIKVSGNLNNHELHGGIHMKHIIKIQKPKKKRKRRKNKNNNNSSKNRKRNKLNNNSKIDQKKIIIKNVKSNSTIVKKKIIKTTNTRTMNNIIKTGKSIAIRGKLSPGCTILHTSSGYSAYVTLLYSEKKNGRRRWRYLWPDDGVFQDKFRKGWLYR